MIWGYIGHEGAGKSAAMCYFDLLHIAKGGGLFTFPGFEVFNPNITLDDGNHPRLGKSIDMKEFISSFSDEQKLRNVLVSMEEIQNINGSDKYMTMKNILITKEFINENKFYQSCRCINLFTYQY